ncbi:MAG: NAD(P)-dependent oxidoreductase [Dysgonomonas sp.]
MKVALIGATGFIGSHILEELLSQNYEVTAIARNVDKIDVKNKNLKAVSLDIIDVEKLTEELKGNSVVICAYNAGWDNPNQYDECLKGYKSIQDATRAANIRRLFVVGNAGSLFIGGKQFVDTQEFPEKMKEGAKASRDYFDALRRETYLDWVYLSPQIEVDSNHPVGRTGRYRTGRDEPILKDGIGSISIQDLAMSIVDEVEDRKYSRQQYTIGY